MKTKHTRKNVAGILALTLGAANLNAQANLANNVVDLEESELVGSYLQSNQANALKSPTPIIDVPQSLSIFTNDQINLAGFNSIGDIINYTPGVNNSQGEGHRDAVVFRGVRSTADFYLDGVRDDVQYYRPLYNVDQVEILRGPNALLFGRGGTGGILNRVSKRGVIGDQFNDYIFTVDSFGETRIMADGNYTLSDDLALRVNLFQENLANHRDFYEGDGFGMNPTLRYQIDESSTLDLSYEYLKQDRFIDRGIPTGANGRPVESLKDIVFGDPDDNYSTHEAHIFRAIFEREFSDTLKGRFSAFHSDHDKLYQNLYASGYDSAANTVTLDGYVDTTQRQSTVFSADLIGEYETGNILHTIVAGVEFLDTSNDNDRYNSNFGTAAAPSDTAVFSIANPLSIRGGFGTSSTGDSLTNNWTNDLKDQTYADVSVFSAYIQDEIGLTDSLDLVLGARLDKFDFDVTDGKAGTSVTDNDEYVTPRAGLVYKAAENISLYGSYSESFLPKSGEQYASVSDTNAKLDPNSFTNLEAGIKWDLNSGLSFTASVFEVEASSPATNDGGETSFIEDSETTGFELQVQGWLSEKWFITAGYASLDAQDKSGSRLRESPESMFSIWNNYVVNDRTGVSLGIVNQGDSLIKTGSTAELPSYTRLDAGVYYNLTDNTRIQLNVENLTDELYFPHSHSTHQASVGASRNALLSISSSF